MMPMRSSLSLTPWMAAPMVMAMFFVATMILSRASSFMMRPTVAIMSVLVPRAW
ncbi:hypothetical protein DSECCO2_419610 [anaerobic digester metagenome]